MTRIKRGFVAKKRRKKILKLNKSFRGSHSRLFTTANQQNMKSLRYSYFDRRKKKRNFKSLWIKRINSTTKKFGINYSQIINKLKIKKIILNKKIISEILLKDEKIFQKLLEV
uniref:ribosomal protein L20 n=1 Tax=Euglena deses TaxID=66845 RepID=UPI0023AABE98|nr:ribosomal protein L20 [Euglena deses]WCH63357.1 ribosomal protein L20 [Euglena deses]